MKAVLRAWSSVLACCAVFALPAAAQTRAARSRLSPDIDVTFAWIGSTSLGARDAQLEAPGGGALALFTTRNNLGSSVGPEVHLTFFLSKHLRAEAVGAWTRGEMRSSISGDFEDAAPAASALSVSVFTAEGAAVWLLPRHGRLEPFLRGGAGWARELTSGGVLNGDGVVANGGGGVKYWWRERDRGWLKRLGLRSEARVVRRTSALSLAGKSRFIAPAFTAGVILGF